MSRVQGREIVKTIILGLGASVAAISIFALPGLAQLVALLDKDGTKRGKQLGQAVLYLKKKKYITVETHNGKEVLVLTEGGKKKYQQFSFEDFTLPKAKKWDKRFRFVMFDVPKGKYRARQLFAWKLTDLGFMQYQRSVYVYPHECKKEMEYLAGYLGLSKHVQYLLVGDFTDKEKMKRFFSLD